MSEKLTLEQIELGERLHKEAENAHYIHERRMASHNLATYAYANLPQLLAAARRELERQSDGPIDQEWLLIIGFRYCAHWGAVDIGDWKNAFAVQWDWGKWSIRSQRRDGDQCDWEHDIPAPQTRNDVLALLHGLGIGESSNSGGRNEH